MASKQTWVGVGALCAAIILGATAYVGLAQPQTKASDNAVPMGKGFDFYVLALSWSPTYCQDARTRARDTVQCAGPRPFAFVVHGLWPQFERGFPRACRTTQSRPTDTAVSAMLDIMPSPRLVAHQWENHGSCSGLNARDYLAVTRAARDAIVVPPQFTSSGQWQRVSAGEVEAAFIAANQGLQQDGIAVSRRGNLLSEVRICLSLDLKPRACAEVDDRGASDDTRLSLPPSRG